MFALSSSTLVGLTDSLSLQPTNTNAANVIVAKK
jgi:hypothetical protein